MQSNNGAYKNKDEFSMYYRAMVRKDTRYKQVHDFFAKVGKLDVLQTFEDVWIDAAVELQNSDDKKWVNAAVKMAQAEV